MFFEVSFSHNTVIRVRSCCLFSMTNLGAKRWVFVDIPPSNMEIQMICRTGGGVDGLMRVFLDEQFDKLRLSYIDNLMF